MATVLPVVENCAKVQTDKARHRQRDLTDEQREAFANTLLSFKDVPTPGDTWMDLLQDKIQRYDVPMPEVTVAYRNLTVTTQALVGNAGIPTVVSPLVHLAKSALCLQERAEERQLKLLDSVSGVLKPGRLTLLLGPPSSGKSTYLRTLAGRLHVDRITQVQGELTFNGLTPDQFRHPMTCSYVSQIDNHEPNLTVLETLDFAYLCQTGTKGSNFSLPYHIRKKKLLDMAADVEKGVALSAKPGSGGVAGVERHSADSHDGSSSTNHTGASDEIGSAAVTPVSVDGIISKAKDPPNSVFGGGGGGVCRKKAKDTPCPDVDLDEFEDVLEKVWGTGVKVDVVMRLLGLSHCRETQVGNEIFRGISGGERKRLTTAELLLGPHNVLCLDEISTGLDSATLFTVIKWFSKWCHAGRKTMIISLLQPPPEVFWLFDDVLIFANGSVLYHGPVGDAVPFCKSVGFDCPARKDVPSFLLEVTTPAGQQAYASEELKATLGVPHGLGRVTWTSTGDLLVPLADISAAFWSKNKHGVAMAQDLQSALKAAPPADKASAAAAADPAVEGRHDSSSSGSSSSGLGSTTGLVTRQGYPLGWWESIVVASKRQVVLVMRDKVLLKGRIMQVLVLSLLSSSLFYKLGVSLPDARTFFGVSFLWVLLSTFGGFPQMPITLEAKKIWFKHRENCFLPAYAYGIAMAVAQIPISFIEAVIFSLIQYFMVDLYRSAGHFFLFFVITMCNSLVSSAIFRFLGCASPNQVLANAYGGLLLVTLVITSGFAIIRFDIPAWMIWAYWLSPFAWGLRSYAINELTSPKWQGLAYPDNPSKTLGNGALESFGFFTERYWIGAGIGYQLGLFAFLTFLSIIALWLSQPERRRASLPDEDAVRREKAAAESRRREMSVHKKVAAKLEVAAPDSGDASSNSPDDSHQPQQKSIPSPRSYRRMESTGATGATGGVVDIASSLEFQPIRMVFKNIGYSVPNPNYSRSAAKEAAAAAAANKAEQHHVGDAPSHAQPRLQLLTGITGYAVPGVLTALMGGSGAGKTTLMDCLCGRKTVGEITGDILVNGHAKDQRSWSRVVGYCEQNDIHTPLQTVREALVFSARLRLPPSVDNERVEAYVDEVLDMVDMTDIMYGLVGSPGDSGLSVEQRKRLTIAVELVANPSIIFMDEPTSGLDARAAAVVMRSVRNVARNGRTVMVTIHQPSIEIFEAFDMLLLIQRGGRTTYFGDVGEHSSALINYLMKVPGTPPLPLGFNPATWMLEVTGGSMATMVNAVEADWPSIYASSELAAAQAARADELVQEDLKAGTPALTMASEYAMPFNVQGRLLLQKFILMYWRNPSYNLSRFFITFTTSWIYAAVYWGQGKIQVPATIANVQAVMGIMYSSTNFLGMTNLMSVMPLVGYERVVFYRERGASMYNPFAYGFAMALVELPYLLAQSLMFVPIMYWTVHFDPTAEKFFYYFLMFLANIAFYNIFGQFLVYVTPSQAIAQVLGGTCNFLMNIFNGFMITYPDIAIGYKWINRIVPTTWMIYGLASSQLDQQEPIMYNGRMTTIKQFMEERFGYFTNMRWWCLLIVFGYIIFVRVTSILALRYWNFLRR